MPRIHVDDALQWLRCPFEIILENQQSDRQFLNAFMDPDQRAFIEARERKQWLKFENGGGVDNMATIVRKHRAVRDGRWLVTWLLSDSDSLVGGECSTKVRGLQQACTAPADNRGAPLPGRALPHHTLRRRSIENYLTESALRGWLRSGRSPQHATEDAVAAHLRMTDAQRHHYNVKEGFERDQARLTNDRQWIRLRAEIEDLYRSLPADDRQALARG